MEEKTSIEPIVISLSINNLYLILIFYLTVTANVVTLYLFLTFFLFNHLQ